MVVEFYDFMFQIIRDVTGLIIILGLLLFVVSFVKISGKIELLNPDDCNKCRAIGAIFLLIGFGAIIYPKTIIVQGKITYWDGNPANSVRVEIGNTSTTSNSEGRYELEGVPRSANSIDFVFPKYTISKGLNVPFYSLISQNISVKMDKINFTIAGTVFDEFGNPLKNVAVMMGTIKSYAPTGQYQLSQVSIDPKWPNYIVVTDPNNNVLSQNELKFSKYETEEKYKNYEINVNPGNTIDVFGTVKDYCGQKGVRPEPVIGAIIEMGGRYNLTNEDGEYSISKVPRGATSCRIRLISGTEKTKDITPPLIDSSPFEKKTQRLLIICLND
jgi:hypothetical protein